MKYNPKTNERQANLPGLAGAHPLLPNELCQGALQLMYELEQYLAAITGMAAVSLQPAAGAQGELTGMLIFFAHHKSKGERRSKILIPDTAHGTNPASAALCGFKSIAVQSNPNGVPAPETVAALMDEETRVPPRFVRKYTLRIFIIRVHPVASHVERSAWRERCAAT